MWHWTDFDFLNTLLKLGCLADSLLGPDKTVLIHHLLLKIRSARILDQSSGTGWLHWKLASSILWWFLTLQFQWLPRLFAWLSSTNSERGNLIFWWSCYFLQNLCIYLQLTHIFSNPYTFCSNFSYSTWFGAHSLLCTHVCPLGKFRAVHVPTNLPIPAHLPSPTLTTGSPPGFICPPLTTLPHLASCPAAPTWPIFFLSTIFTLFSTPPQPSTLNPKP